MLNTNERVQLIDGHPFFSGRIGAIGMEPDAGIGSSTDGGGLRPELPFMRVVGLEHIVPPGIRDSRLMGIEEEIRLADTIEGLKLQ